MRPGRQGQAWEALGSRTQACLGRKRLPARPSLHLNFVSDWSPEVQGQI